MSNQQTSAPDTDRSARVIQRAIEIMAQGARGWSEALARARAEIRA
jgi:hypothetical protein